VSNAWFVAFAGGSGNWFANSPFCLVATRPTTRRYRKIVLERGPNIFPMLGGLSELIARIWTRKRVFGVGSGRCVGGSPNADADRVIFDRVRPHHDAHMPAVRPPCGRDHADKRLRAFLRVLGMPSGSPTEIRGLLRLLFLWIEPLPASAA
jgi:hypothetical protein